MVILHYYVDTQNLTFLFICHVWVAHMHITFICMNHLKTYWFYNYSYSGLYIYSKLSDVGFPAICSIVFQIVKQKLKITQYHTQTFECRKKRWHFYYYYNSIQKGNLCDGRTVSDNVLRMMIPVLYLVWLKIKIY